MRDEGAWVEVERIAGRGWRERKPCCLRVAKGRDNMAEVFVVVLLRVMVGLTCRCEVEVKSGHGLDDMVWYRNFRLQHPERLSSAVQHHMTQSIQHILN